MSKNFADKVAFITGAASGLGRATALAFAEQGASVFLIDINQQGLNETQEMINKIGTPCAIQVVDVSRKTTCDAAVAAAVKQFGKLNVLCNVAGWVAFFHAAKITEAEWEKSLAVNLNGPFYLCQAAIPHLLNTHGSIVNVASIGGTHGQAYTVPYSTAKAGLINMTRSLAVEYAHQPIRINVITPGHMDTTMGRGVNFPEGLDMSLVQRFMNLRPAANPAEVANFILYLASDQSPSIHGACLAIDGGTTAG